MINDDVTIIGPGSDKLTMNTVGNAFEFGGPATVSISGLTIKAGQDAVHSAVGGSLTLSDIDATGTVDYAVYYEGGSDADTVSLTGITTSGSASDGIWVEMNDGTATLTDVTANGNAAAGISLGAVGDATVAASALTANGNSQMGFWLSASDSASITIDGLIADQNATSGVSVAGIDPDAAIDISHALISANGETGVVGDFGGGLEGAFGLSDSSVTGNGDPAGSGFLGGGITLALAGEAQALIQRTTVDGNDGLIGGIFLVQQGATSFSLQSSTISGNTGILAGAIFGIGGSSDGAATADIVNSTISGNTAGIGVGGIVNSGGDPDALVVTIANSTIVANVSDPSAEAEFVFGDAIVTIANSIFAGESGPSNLASEGSTVTIHHSLVQVPDASIDAALTAGAGNLTGIDPDLGPLADNRGPTMTHLPADASPVVGAGDPAFTGLTTDQRGETRVVGILDMGSVELGARLAATGADAVVPVTGGLLLLGAGLLFLVARRRALKV